MYGIPFPIMRGNLPEAWILSAIRGDQRKRLMGTAFPLADPSISGQVPGSRVTGHLKAAGSAASLGGDAFGDKYAAFRRALPERLDRRIGWRVVPGARFLRAVKGDHHDALWRFALERLGLAATNEVVVLERRQRFRHLLPIFLHGSGVGYIADFGDDVSRRSLDLLGMNRFGASDADRDASQHGQR